jgi:serine/threonine-protein kinase ULK/ATG1
MSKFYINNNKVIDHPSDIGKKEEVNNYAIDVAKRGQKVQNYQGSFIKRETIRPLISEDTTNTTI